MAKLEIQGLKEYGDLIKKLGKNSEKIERSAIYEGAKIVADEVRKGINSLPIVYGYGTPSRPLPGGVTAEQKRGLQEGFGITPMAEKDGFLNVRIGFDGYNRTKTEKYPNGQPNQLVARGVESGTSWKQKHPFVRPAVNRARKRAHEKMDEIFEEEVKKL